MPKKGELVQNAKSYIIGHAKELGIDFIKEKDLELAREKSFPGIHTLLFQQMLKGYPMIHGTILLELDNLEVKQIIIKVRKANPVPKDLPSPLPISSEKAIDLALSNFYKSTLVSAPKPPSLGYFRIGSKDFLAYVVDFSFQQPSVDWSVVIDSITGKILIMKKTMDSFVNGKGYVISPNPVVKAMNNDIRNPSDKSTCGFQLPNQYDTFDKINTLHSYEDLKEITFQNSVYSLEGHFVKVLNENNVPLRVQNSGDFMFGIQELEFEHVMVYYHVDLFQRYLQNLGLRHIHEDRPFKVIIDSNDILTPRAYFSNNMKTAFFGRRDLNSRCLENDPAEDGDTILHEYAHALLYNQVESQNQSSSNSFTDEFRSIGEGMAMFVPCAYFVGINNYQAEVFGDWSYTGNAAPIRLNSRGLTYEEVNDLLNNGVYNMDQWIYAAGRVWAETLYLSFLEVGCGTPNDYAKDICLKSLFESHICLADDSDIIDAAEAFLRRMAKRGITDAVLLKVLQVIFDRRIFCETGQPKLVVDKPTFGNVLPLPTPNPLGSNHILITETLGHDVWIEKNFWTLFFGIKLHNHGTRPIIDLVRAFIINVQIEVKNNASGPTILNLSLPLRQVGYGVLGGDECIIIFPLPLDAIRSANPSSIRFHINVNTQHYSWNGSTNSLDASILQ